MTFLEDKQALEATGMFDFSNKKIPRPIVGSAAPRKDDTDKVRYDLIPPNALHELASVYTMGAQKYAAHNWLSGNGLQYSRLFSAIMRHCWAWIAGEDLDPESGLHHMAHAAFSCFAIVEYHRLKKGIDDRYDKLQNQTRNEQSETTTEESRRQT
jgi:hypothetical protein